MSRVITDTDLLNWEIYASGGRFGLPDDPKIVFHCLSDPEVRARYVRFDGDNAGAEGVVHEMSIEQLQAMLAESRPLE